MTAGTLAPAAAIAEKAHAVLHGAFAIRWPQDRKTRRAIGRAAVGLGDALDIYRALDDGVLHWEAVYPHLSGAADPHGDALEKAAGEADLAARNLVTVIAACCGTEVADVMDAAAGETA